MLTREKPFIVWSKSRLDKSTVKNQRVTNSMINMKQLNKKKTLPLVIRGIRSNSKIAAARMWVRKCCSGENRIRLKRAVQRREFFVWIILYGNNYRKRQSFYFLQTDNFKTIDQRLNYQATAKLTTFMPSSNFPSINATHDLRQVAWKLNAGLNRSGANQCVLCTYVAMIMLSDTAVFFARDYTWNIERSFKAARHSFLWESWRHPRQWLLCMRTLRFDGKCLATEILIYLTETSTRRFNKAANCHFRFQMSPFVTQLLF